MKPTDFLAQYRNHPTGAYPMCSHQFQVFPQRNEFGDANIGWNCGMLDGTRPYFLECWATDEITVLTFFFSSIGIEMLGEDAVEMILIRNDLYVKKANAPAAAVTQLVDDNGNDMYSVNVIVGDEDEMYLENGCPVFPFRQLNEMNTLLPDTLA